MKKISCSLDGQLSKYKFVERNGIAADQAIRETLDLIKIAPNSISFPLMSFMFLAPLNYFLSIAGITPSFGLFAKGPTGCFKTTLSMLWLALFREYGISDPPPANFASTSNAVERMAFTLKDSVLLVDDYHPTTTQEKRKMDELAQRLARGAGDHLSRGRMNSDTTLKASYPPRGLVIITGEDAPSIGQSGLARFFFVEFEKSSVDKALLTERQKHADRLNVCMSFFIEWLIAKADTLPGILQEMFMKYRSMVNIDGAHSRIPSNIAHLQIGAAMFASFANESGVFTVEEARAFMDNAWETIIQSATEQAKALQEAQPVTLFLTALNELLSTGKKSVQRLGGSPDNSFSDIIGFEDDQYYYLFPETLMNSVIEFYRNQDGSFPVSKSRLFNDLAKAELIETTGQRNTIVKRIESKNVRVLMLKKSAFEIINGKDEKENG